MLTKLGRGLLVLVLSVSVLLGAYLGYQRYLIELGERTVELCFDLNDIRRVAAFDKKPLDHVLKRIRQIGFTSVGLFEQTLPEANAAGELYYAKGSGLLRLKGLDPELKSLLDRRAVQAERTYLFIPEQAVRRRVYDQLRWALGEKELKFLGRNVIEVNEAEEELRPLGLGLSETQVKYLTALGFAVVPRVWNDPRYHLGSIGPKVAALAAHRTIIFDGEEILGYPDVLSALASALKKERQSYGYIEIVKQLGDARLRRLMGREVVRVHSVPKNELKKLDKEEVVRRFVRAVRERKVNLIYVRPFLPPQVDAYPVEYNLKFFAQVKQALEQAGFVVGPAEKGPELKPSGWQVVLLGTGVVIGAVFLLNAFLPLPILVMYLLVALGAGALYWLAGSGPNILPQKALALLAAVVFPAHAVISSFSRRGVEKFLPWDATRLVLNVVAETMVGVFLLVGLLADTRFMLGVETFAGVKLALVVPIGLVALCFILRQGTGGLRERLASFLNSQVRMSALIAGVLVLGGLGIYLARSGNFILPVPVGEKYLRYFLEHLFFIRPRTKEFLFGYPLLYLAAFALFRGKTRWLWLLAALGAIAPISILNTFSHIHTPLVVSLVRTVNGLVLGVTIGLLLGLFIKYIPTLKASVPGSEEPTGSLSGPSKSAKEET